METVTVKQLLAPAMVDVGGGEGSSSLSRWLLDGLRESEGGRCVERVGGGQRVVELKDDGYGG